MPSVARRYGSGDAGAASPFERPSRSTDAALRAPDEDEEFVRDLAARYGIPCTIRRVDVAALAAASPDGNVENAGREVRYSEATRLANELSAQLGTPRSAARILTAHTANARAATFVHPTPPQPRGAPAARPHARRALRVPAHARHRVARGRHKR